MKDSYTDKEILKMERSFPKFLKRFRSEIPEIRNKVPVLDEFTNEDITFLVNISNRTDGKTFQYVNFFIQFSLEYGIGFTFIARHYDLRQAYMENIEDVFRKEKRLILNHLSFQRRNEYTMVFYKDECIGIIAELTNATDFKYHASIAVGFPVIWYDEFLALDRDYIRGEWQALQTIYETINRYPQDIPIIKHPKIIFGGNPVNFDSPVLLELDLFNKLESSDMGKLVTTGHTALIIEQNKEVNKLRNTDAFGGGNDAMTTAVFVMNKHSIIQDPVKNKILADGDSFYIKLETQNVGVFYLIKEDRIHIYLSVMSSRLMTDNVAYCELLKDKTDDTEFITEKFFKEKMYKKYDKGIILFDNVFSKNQLTENNYFMQLNILKMIKHQMYTPQISKEDKYIRTQESARKEFIAKRFLDVYRGF